MQWGSLNRTDAVLLTTVLFQALIVISSRFLVEHDVAPRVYIALRFAIATPLLASIAARADGGLSVAGRRTAALAATAVVFGFGSQTAFAHAISRSSAATVGVITGSVPILATLIAAMVRVERLTPRIAVAASISLLGVALVTLGPGSALAGSAVGSASRWSQRPVGQAIPSRSSVLQNARRC